MMTIEKGAKKNSNCVDPQFKKINILSSSSSCEKREKTNAAHQDVHVVPKKVVVKALSFHY